MRILITALFTAAIFGLLVSQSPANAEFSGITGAINDVSDGIEDVQAIGGQVGGIIDGIGGIGAEIDAITGGSGPTTTTTGTSQSGMFNPNTVFPAWGEGGQVTGVIGSNNGALNQGDSRLLIYFIPKIVELLIWLIAPIITVMFLYSGFIFVYAGDREEEVKKGKDFFKFAVIGLTFIVLSYSLMKAVFFLLA
jgi:hypothetical protein